MKKYESILKRVEEVQYKLGISYAKTSGKLYKTSWWLCLLGVVYLFLVNTLVILSSLLNKANGQNVSFSNQTLLLLGLSVIFAVVGIILSKNTFHIIGSALCILPVPYLVYIFIKACYSYGQGLFNILTIFYTRHLPSLVLITVFGLIMLFVAVREKIKVNRAYKRIITNLYINYKNGNADGISEITNEEWEDFIKNYSPKNM